jgi:hypothetical protein
MNFRGLHSETYALKAATTKCYRRPRDPQPDRDGVVHILRGAEEGFFFPSNFIGNCMVKLVEAEVYTRSVGGMVRAGSARAVVYWAMQGKLIVVFNT